MKAKNTFYLGKGSEETELLTTSYKHDGTSQQVTDIYGYPYGVGVNNRAVIIPPPDLAYTSIEIICFDSKLKYLGSSVDNYEYSRGKRAISMIKNTVFAVINFTITDETQLTRRKWFDLCYIINPHYKQLKKRFKKENNQMFFRESLDGKLNIFGTDYSIVKDASLEETLHLYVYRNNSMYASASFNKSDCTFDYFKQSVELKLKYRDKYSKILDAYENTYDLIKLAPALTRLTLTKRPILQVYIQGENVVSNYSGGAYWETEVDEPINDFDSLKYTYYFSEGTTYTELNLEGFNYDINGEYASMPYSNIWNAYRNGSIVFTKVHDEGDVFDGTNEDTVKLLSSGEGSGLKHEIVPGPGTEPLIIPVYRYDTYIIEIYTGRDGTGNKIYQSKYMYGKDSDFMIASGSELYPMIKVDQPALDPAPATFNLGQYEITYQVWGRMLCDVDTFIDIEGQTRNTHDLPKNDFATPRRNYKKCFGAVILNNQVAHIFQSRRTSEEPTSYGMNDYGKYFLPPTSSEYYYPLAKSSWANSSLWIRLGNSAGEIGTFEGYCSRYYKEYSIDDTYHIGDVIKAILAKIDPSIVHEKTPEYSSFLYGHSGGTASILGNCDIYIAQKTNILKGDYDQAAQKAEIKFKQLMEMLRDCFRCYWFIDDQNRFRIEHVSYFMQGLSYNHPAIQMDLTLENDKFNKKSALYCQQKVEYDKTDLSSRYEFKYMDNTTKAMGGDLHVDVNNAYIQKDKVEEINISAFTADVDYMLFLPDDFSNDGFALLLADSNRKVPIIDQVLIDEKQDNKIFQVYVQNWYASFNQLIWHYMEDFPGRSLEYNNIPGLYASHVKRCIKHTIEFPSSESEIDIYKLIKTDIGNGYIEEVSTNIDTDMTEVELRYMPPF